MVSLRSNLDLASSSSSALPLPPVREGGDADGQQDNGEPGESEDVSEECARLLAEGKKRNRAYNAKIKELDSLKEALKDKKTVQQDCNLVVPVRS